MARHLYMGDGGEDFTSKLLAYMVMALSPNVSKYIAPILSKMKPTISDDNNTITIAPGIAVCDGRMIIIEKSETDSFVVPNGTQGVKTDYYLGYHIYTDADGKQLIEQATVSTTMQTATTLLNGGSELYVYLWMAERNGATLEKVTQLCPTVSVNYSTVTAKDAEVAKISGATDSGSTSGGSSSGSSSDSGSSTTTPTNTYKATTNLNIRSGAGSSYSLVGTLAKGATRVVYATQNGWYKIKVTESGSSYGWVASNYMSKVS